MYEEVTRNYLTSGKLYKVVEFFEGDAVIKDDDGDEFFTWNDDNYTAYQLLKSTAQPDGSSIEVDGLRYDKVEGALEVGDYVISNVPHRDLTVGKKYKVLSVDSDGDANIKDDVNISNHLRLREIKAVYRCNFSEREKSFVKFGREVDEFKIGDFVQIIRKPNNVNGYNVVGSIHEVDAVRTSCVHLKHVTPRHNGGGTYTLRSDIKLVAPVERLS
ncbi:hypothetical protein [Paenilisteria rocourtiae]|nr:hypothetical protein [Listeria rocourtiae]